MESLTNTPRTAVKQQRFSEVVYSLISYNRQKGFQTTIFHSLAILLSISILFLLTQVYLIFLPCLKALLWALLCGSALYPFKAILDQSVESWLDELNQTERPFCVGFILLPFKSISKLYLLLIHFVAQNKILFIVFHFRFQIFHLLSLACGFLYPILQHNKGIITTTFILCISSQIFLMLLGSRHNFLRVLSTFNFVPSIILLAFFYLLHYLGLVGYVAFILFSLISMLGFIITVNGLRREHQSALFAELNTIVNTFGERLNAWIQNRLEPLRGKFADDSIDGDTNLGQQYTVALFTIFVFVIAEQMNLAYIILILFSIHIVVKKIIDHVYERLMIIGEIVSFYYNSLKNITLETLRKDILFQSLIYFFLKGDEMIKQLIRESLHLLTCLGVISIVSVMIICFSVILSIKIYGECNSAINLLRNELSNIQFIKDSINRTLTDMTNINYLTHFLKHNLFPSDKLDLDAEEEAFVNKMLFDLGENILAFLNSTQQTQNRTLAENQTTNGFLIENEHLRSMVGSLSIVNIKRFNPQMVVNFVNTRANQFLPLLKSFSSIFYTLIFVILDGSSVLLNYVLNFIIFILALFYLLSTSRRNYKPIEFMDTLTNSLVANPEQNQLSRNVEEVVNSIFAATIKISAFYGIYTWLVHSLFNIQIACIPSVIAAILAAVPVLNAYWASLPGCIYLYYFDPSLPVLKAISMFVIAITPSFIVDSSIYSDIKRAGHPYLTGLAITCGVVYYGVEGALFGPLWLCFLVIILNVCTSLTEKNDPNRTLDS